MTWCSGSQICLTHRMSPVHAWVASVFDRVIFSAVFSLAKSKTQNQSKSSRRQEALNNQLKPFDRFKKKFRVHINNKTQFFSLNQQPHEMTINNSLLQMRNNTQF